ncbi:MAG: hypothetical protein ACK559_04520, partial [bacterium]
MKPLQVCRSGRRHEGSTSHRSDRGPCCDGRYSTCSAHPSDTSSGTHRAHGRHRRCGHHRGHKEHSWHRRHGGRQERRRYDQLACTDHEG